MAELVAIPRPECSRVVRCRGARESTPTQRVWSWWSLRLRVAIAQLAAAKSSLRFPAPELFLCAVWHCSTTGSGFHCNRESCRCVTLTACLITPPRSIGMERGNWRFPPGAAPGRQSGVPFAGSSDQPVPGILVDQPWQTCSR